MPDDLAGFAVEFRRSLAAQSQEELARQWGESCRRDARIMQEIAEERRALLEPSRPFKRIEEVRAEPIPAKMLCDFCGVEIDWRAKKYPVKAYDDLRECDRCHTNANGNQRIQTTWIGRLVTYVFGELWGARGCGF